MFPLASLSVLEFNGHDAGQFLHDQLSADILAIEPGESGFACCCIPSGRVMALMLVCPVGDSYFALCAHELAEDLTNWLNRFVFRAKLKIHLRKDLQVFAGEGTEAINDAIELKTGLGLSYTVGKHSEEPATADESAESSWKLEELRKGVCWLDQATTAKYLPQMLGFESIDALNFNKGCYPCQEIIARTRYLGKLKRRPVLISTGENLTTSAGDKIELLEGENSFSAIVVDTVVVGSVDGNAGETVLLLVARMGPETRPERIRFEGQETAIQKS
jgi:folate-binding protein YgfZ